MMRREVRYPERFSVSVSSDTKLAIEALSRRYDIAPGVLARWAIDDGLPVLRDRLRKGEGGPGPKERE